MTREELDALGEEIATASSSLSTIFEEISIVVVGQQHLIKRLLIGLLSNGHVLLEGVPGLAKTTTIKALADCLHAQFSRIQFTPDLLPSDVVGTIIYNPDKNEYFAKKGPIFGNLLLADEINRAPAKVQSALLEAMQERQVTLGDETHRLPDPFLVLATQNPVEQEGTYPLPEAQLDRFMMKVTVDYGTAEEERRILDLMISSQKKAECQPVFDLNQLRYLRNLADSVYVDENVRDYIIGLVMATRKATDLDPKMGAYIRCGSSPRATINLTHACKAHALMEGRSYATPYDVKAVAPEILGHRILRTYEAEADEVSCAHIVQWVLDTVVVP
ncbi:AAA family ATPase [Cerasicoccus frondis]|uniref:AAA family ATPase n=1 Tax=Cerasicoccus frondis TaxID=490090 RepID=UPI0028525F6D|nr:MoxR family ATPase [Cerasicoccus frondis]